MMTTRVRLFYWFAAVFSFVAAGYFGNSALHYAWLAASAPQQWSGERATPFVYGNLALAVFFVVVLIYCGVALGRDANGKNRNGDIARTR